MSFSGKGLMTTLVMSLVLVLVSLVASSDAAIRQKGVEYTFFMADGITSEDLRVGSRMFFFDAPEMDWKEVFEPSVEQGLYKAEVAPSRFYGDYLKPNVSESTLYLDDSLPRNFTWAYRLESFDYSTGRVFTPKDIDTHYDSVYLVYSGALQESESKQDDSLDNFLDRSISIEGQEKTFLGLSDKTPLSSEKNVTFYKKLLQQIKF